MQISFRWRGKTKSILTVSIRIVTGKGFWSIHEGRLLSYYVSWTISGETEGLIPGMRSSGEKAKHDVGDHISYNQRLVYHCSHTHRYVDQKVLQNQSWWANLPIRNWTNLSSCLFSFISMLWCRERVGSALCRGWLQSDEVVDSSIRKRNNNA